MILSREEMEWYLEGGSGSQEVYLKWEMLQYVRLWGDPEKGRLMLWRREERITASCP